MNHLIKSIFVGQQAWLRSEPILFVTLVSLASFGLIMVGSTSLDMSSRVYDQPFYILTRQAIHLGVGMFAFWFLQKIPMRYWQNQSLILLGIGIFLLVLVLIPGIGREVNGSTRWIGVRGFSIQVSELAKLIMIIYLSRFLVQYNHQVRSSLIGFIKPVALLGVVAGLLLLEPDFGAAVVIVGTTMILLFLGGVRLWTFILLFLLALTCFFFLAITSPYRLARLTTFLNPWENQFDSGYQLTQSLIAFGRGGWFGMGLGESIQKLFYLPEAHTDFIFAVITEELGLFGGFGVLLLFGILIWRGLFIGHQAHQQRLHFNGYLAQGISLWFAIQVIISVGVNTGVLPTKGLTLPLISYGGSSMVINCLALAMLFRIAYENKEGQKWL